MASVTRLLHFSSVVASVRNLLRGALHVALPPLCVGCDALSESPHGFCAPCWQKLTFITAPSCARCSLPFAFEGAAPEMLCGACLTEPPRFEKARAPLVYDDGIRALLLSFKHHDRTDLAPSFTRLMAGVGDSMLKEADIILPVPLHFTRLFLRRYNQSALLAKNLAHAYGKRIFFMALSRKRPTPTQGHLSRAERFKNVKGAFQVRASAQQELSGKRILLIDDVMTTGATASACAAALYAAGAAEVNVLTLARVVKAE